VTNLNKRERQAIDYISTVGFELNAYSISFDITRGRVRSIVYYNRSEMQTMAKELAADKENGGGTAPTRTHVPPPAPPPPPPRSQDQVARSSATPHVQNENGPNFASTVQSRKARACKVDKNVLSARSGTVLSDAAVAAQARADAKKELQARKRPRVDDPPSLEHVPLSHSSSRDLADVSEEETQQLEAVAKRNSFPVPKTSEEAETFLRAIMGLNLYESEGLCPGETPGEIVGYNILNGENYGGPDAPLPPGARAAFVMAKGGWQAVPARKGKPVNREH